MPALAPPGDPLVTPDGRILEAEGRPERDFSLTIPNAKNLTTSKNRSLREVGSDPQTQSVVNAVLVYKLMGVSVNEIAHIMNTDPLEIHRVMDLDLFQETFEMVFKELLSVNSNSLQARMGRYAGKAFENLMNLADAKPVSKIIKDDDDNLVEVEHYSVPPMVILKANESVLDRSGLSAEHLFGKNAQSDAPQLEIEITSASDNKPDLNFKVKVGR